MRLIRAHITAAHPHVTVTGESMVNMVQGGMKAGIMIMVIAVVGVVDAQDLVIVIEIITDVEDHLTEVAER